MTAILVADHHYSVPTSYGNNYSRRLLQRFIQFCRIYPYTSNLQLLRLDKKTAAVHDSDSGIMRQITSRVIFVCCFWHTTERRR